jgi:hypothetical protein
LGKSAEGFEHGLALFPMDERLLVKCGLAYAQLGDFAKADQVFVICHLSCASLSERQRPPHFFV